MAVAGAASACASPAATTGPAPFLADTTFYISARAREGGRSTRRLAERLEYGFFVTTRKVSEDPLTDHELPFRLADSVQLTRTEFRAALAARTAPGDFAVLYTHGFGTSLHEGWKQAVHSRLRSQGRQPWVVFSWPASDSWVSWPKGGNLLSASYRADSAMATSSRSAFLDAFAAVREAVGTSRLLIFTHSLGIQVAAEALTRPDAPRAALAAEPLRGMAFYAADIGAPYFTEVLVPAVRPLTRRLVIYASSDDRALRLAQSLSRVPRAGRIRAKYDLPVLHPALESVDVTIGASAEGYFRRLFGARHGVRHANAALFDLVHVVGAGRSPACRDSIGSAARTAPTAWRLRPSVLPTVGAAAACAPSSP